jgi:A/G-specific adenine glycosylase
LPWQRSRDPYAIWVSEIMLQQTQVATVIPYFERFLANLPDVHTLAAADSDQVMRLWSGLGYYSRARHLHRAAQTLVTGFGGVFPRQAQILATLPGVGRSTAGAIAALAFGTRCAILDANVKRVLTRAFGVTGDSSASAGLRALWSLAERLVPERDVEAYTQGMMDLGATVCLARTPRCESCPLCTDCVAANSEQTERLPPIRTRRSRRERSVTMLLLHHRAQLLLEKRPPSGIWGGLWCLPQVEPDVDPAAACAQRFGAHDISIEPLPPFVHDFTHLRMHIHPLRIRVGRLAAGCSEPGALWLSVGEARRSALPAPIKKLLDAE